jgi:hypothetical protein
VKEAAFLLAMQRQIGGVYIQNDLGGRALVRLYEHFQQQFVDPVLPVGDPLVTVRYARAQFHPVQRALAGQRLLQRFPSRQDAEDQTPCAVARDR